MQIAAAAPAVLAESTIELPADARALHLAPIQTRTHLTILGYCGNITVATTVVSLLMQNAVQHGLLPQPSTEPLRLRLATTEAGSLVIEVRDLTPAFPDFDAAVRGEHGRGLWGARRLGATITWFQHHGASGKTVRAELPYRPAEP